MPYDPTRKLQPSLIHPGGMGNYEEDFFNPAPPMGNLGVVPFLRGLYNEGAPGNQTKDDNPNALAEYQARIPVVTTAKTDAGAPVAPDPVPEAPPETQSKTDTGAADLQEYIRLVKELMGTRNQVNPHQDQAYQYALRERERTRLLAQLAFSSGVTAAGGGSWKEVAQGFNNAGNVYDQGFQRYQEALQKSADRYQKTADQTYEDHAAATAAGLDLYTSARKEGREAVEQRRKEMREWLELMKPQESEFGVDPEAQRLYEERVLTAGRGAGFDFLFDFNDVSD